MRTFEPRSVLEYRGRSRSYATIQFLLVHDITKQDPPNALQDVVVEKITMHCVRPTEIPTSPEVFAPSRIDISNKINKARCKG